MAGFNPRPHRGAGATLKALQASRTSRSGWPMASCGHRASPWWCWKPAKGECCKRFGAAGLDMAWVRVGKAKPPISAVIDFRNARLDMPYFPLMDDTTHYPYRQAQNLSLPLRYFFKQHFLRCCNGGAADFGSGRVKREKSPQTSRRQVVSIFTSHPTLA